MSIRDVELIWLWRVLLPALLLFYCACAISVLLDALGVLGPQHGHARVVQLALEGHLAAGGILGLMVALGANLLRATGCLRASGGLLERALFSLAVGFALVVAVAFGLALLGRLGPVGTGAAFGGLLVATTWAARREPLPRDEAWFGAALAWRQTRGSSASIWMAGVLALVAVGAWTWPLAVQTALPNSDWDSALYHLPLAERYLRGEVWNADPLFSAHSFPGAISLVYAVFLGLGLEHAIIPFNALAVVATLVSVYAIGRRVGGAPCGAWAAFVLAGTHTLWQQAVDPRVDGFLALFLAWAALALCVLAMEKPRVWMHLVLGVSLGLAIGTKYTGLFAAGAYALGWLGIMGLRREREALRPAIAAGALCLTAALIPHGAWYVANGVLHGDPLFPMLRGDYYTDDARPGERIPTNGAFDQRLEDLDERAEALARQLEPRDSIQVATTLFDVPALFRLPERYATKPNHFVSPLLLLGLLGFFALPGDSKRRRAAGVVVALGFACFVGIGSQTNLVRYALPFLALIAVGAGLVLARFGHPAWRAVWLLLGGFVLVSNHQAESRKLERLAPAYFAEVDADPIRWLARTGYNFTPAMPRTIAHINGLIAKGTVAPDCRVLLVGEGKGRRLACDTLPDLSWFLQRFAVELLRADFDHAKLRESLARQGITHVLYNPGYFRWVGAHTNISKRQLAFTMTQLDRFLARHGEPVAEVAGMRFVALVAEPGESATQPSGSPNDPI